MAGRPVGDWGILGALSSGLGLGPIHSHEETEGHCLWERKAPENNEGVKESQEPECILLRFGYVIFLHFRC